MENSNTKESELFDEYTMMDVFLRFITLKTSYTVQKRVSDKTHGVLSESYKHSTKSKYWKSFEKRAQILINQVPLLENEALLT